MIYDLYVLFISLFSLQVDLVAPQHLQLQAAPGVLFPCHPHCPMHNNLLTRCLVPDLLPLG